MSEPQLFIVGKRRGGRPRATEPRSSVSTWIPVSQHDQLVRLANQREVSVSTLVKSLIYVGLKRDGAA